MQTYKKQILLIGVLSFITLMMDLRQLWYYVDRLFDQLFFLGVCIWMGYKYISDQSKDKYKWVYGIVLSHCLSTGFINLIDAARMTSIRINTIDIVLSGQLDFCEVENLIYSAQEIFLPLNFSFAYVSSLVIFTFCLTKLPDVLHKK